MSALPMIMTFESLPNEIVIDLFDYLNGFDIFYSFDQLNSRLQRLIRHIPLHLDFQHVRKTTFDQFCTVLTSNPEIKKQIHSLILSNKDTCGQIDLFLSLFSLEEFSHLQSFTLIQIEQINAKQLKSMLPSMSNLHSFRLIGVFDLKNEENEIVAALSMTNLRVLSIPSVQSLLTHTNKMSILTHLTIAGCTLDQLVCQLFRYTSLLKYLNIHNIYKSSHPIKIDQCSTEHCAVHLKEMIIDNYENIFDEFEIVMQLTPNMKRLTIAAFDNLSMLDACRWKQLIRSSLHFLNRFQFTFGFYCKSQVRNDIIEKFKQFQTDFWSEQHRWYIEYILNTNSAVIYTIPYLSHTYRLTRCTEKYSNKLMNDCRVFDHVTDLTLCYEAIAEKQYYYFSNVRSLKLESTFVTTKADDDDDHRLKIQHIKSLKTIVDLYNLTHLDISSYSAIETSSLLEAFTAAPQLSSLTIDPFILSTIFNDTQLCKHLTKMIKRLNIHKYSHDSFSDSNELRQFCEIFSNLEQLTCSVNQSDQFLILLSQSTKLSSIKVFVTPSDHSEQLFTWFRDEAFRLNVIYRINYFQAYTDGPAESHQTDLCIWTGGSVR